MNAHKIEITLTEHGQLFLDNLPFTKGDSVEVIILEHHQPASDVNDYPLAGKVIQYDTPYEPATDIQDWEVFQ